jgi:hypothetical protein
MSTVSTVLTTTGNPGEILFFENDTICNFHTLLP